MALWGCLGTNGMELKSKRIEVKGGSSYSITSRPLVKKTPTSRAEYRLTNGAHSKVNFFVKK